MPNHYLNQYRIIIDWTLVNKLQWNFKQNTTIFIRKIKYEKVVCKLAIWSRSQFVKYFEFVYTDQVATHRMAGEISPDIFGTVKCKTCICWQLSRLPPGDAICWLQHGLPEVWSLWLKTLSIGGEYSHTLTVIIYQFSECDPFGFKNMLLTNNKCNIYLWWTKPFLVLQYATLETYLSISSISLY